jgi:DNA-binding MarR family transcriptional regulator
MTMMAIAHLRANDTTMNNIARKLGTTKQNVKQLITNIERKGYIDILPNDYDRRSCNVKITDSGKRIMIEFSERGIGGLADLFNGFTKEELEVLWGLLKRMYSFDGEKQDGFEEEVDFK